MNRESEHENILTQKGLKNTKSRHAVVEVLQNAQSPLSAEEIYLEVKRQGVSANLSTVYRILELLEKMTLVEKIPTENGKAVFELIHEEHRHHLICTGCRRRVPISDCPLEKLEREVGRETDFSITGHRLELYGICPDCKKVDKPS